MLRITRLSAFALIPIVFALTTAVLGSFVGRAAPGDDGVLLTGTIASASGEKMEGVTVSARADVWPVSVSVFSDAQGQYFFPHLNAGQYKVRVQSVGYEAGLADVRLAGPVQRQDFTLKTMRDFSSQLSGAEWSQALPEATVEDRRMKEVFRNACNGCHNQNMALITPFDQKGWETVIDVMSRIQTTGYSSSDDQAPNPLMDYYKKELAAWLAKVRGPGSPPLKFTLPRRPTGEATLMVVREYDTPERGYGLPGYNDGSDWSQGPLDKLDNAHHHAINATLDFNGNLWFTDDVNLNPYRSVGKIDAKTGKVTDFKVPRPDGLAANVHDIQTDPEGILWFDVGGQLGRIDPNTEKLETYAPPTGMGRVGIFIAVDGKDGVWCLSGPGALRFDRKTKQFRVFKNPTQKSLQGSTATYGIAGDSEGNGWWSQFPIDRVVMGNNQTGATKDFRLPERVNAVEPLFTGDDRKIFQMMGGNLYQGHGMPWGQSPRKLGGDLHPGGNALWVPNWFGQNMTKIDIRTGNMTEYPYPWLDGHGYQTSVDQDHNVWLVFQNGDYVAKFDPTTERWTRYDLPTRGGESHGIQMVAVNGRTFGAVAYWAAGRVAKLEFRTKEEQDALKAEAQKTLRVQ